MQVQETTKLTRKQKIASGEPRPNLGLGQRKKLAADARKAVRKTQYFASLRNFPSSPRKMRLVADIIRGLDVTKALAILKLHPRHASKPLFTLLKSAIASYEEKSQQNNIEDLFVKTITVDGGPMLKRLRPAPQGRAYRVRKRSNHVTIFLGVRGQETVAAVPAPAKPEPKAEAKPAAKKPAAKKAKAEGEGDAKPAAKKSTKKTTKEA